MYNFNINPLNVIVTAKITSHSLKKSGMQAMRSCDLDLNILVFCPPAPVFFLSRGSEYLSINSDELNVAGFRILLYLQGDAEE